MSRRDVHRAVLPIALLAGGLFAPVQAAAQAPPADAGRPGPMAPDSRAGATILPGAETWPSPPPAASPPRPRPGPVTLNFPGVEVKDFAAAVLGAILGLPYAVDPAAHGSVTLVTPQPVAKADVLALAEDALKTAGLALQLRNGVYVVAPLDQARAQAPAVGPDQPGFGNETLKLRYANPVELKKLIDPILPGVVATADPASGVMVLSGAAGQRRSARDIAQQFDMDWLKGMSFALFIPKNTDARLIAPELEKLINAPGSTAAGLVRLIAMDRLNGVIAISQRAQYLDDVRRWVEVLDREGQSSERRLYVYRVQNGRSSDLAKVLISAFGGAAGGADSDQKPPFADTPSGGRGPTGLQPLGAAAQPPSGQTLPGQSPAPAPQGMRAGGSADGLVITSDETNNAVVAYATPREFALIEDALRRLDIPPLQVIIEATITEVTLNDKLQYGVQWFFQHHRDQVSLIQGKGPTPTPAQVFPGFNYTIFNSAGGIAATLNALSGVTHLEVLSSPNLLVLNNQTASRQDGDQVPISTGTAVSTTGGGAPIVSSIDYRDTGVILKVTPRVNGGGLVLLDISQEVSNVNGAALNNPLNSPVISKRKVATSIAARDGETIALGGLISDNNTKMRGGVPILSAVPVLGALAGNRDNSRQRTELLILLTPKVVRNQEEAETVTDELKRKIRSIAPKAPKFEP